MIDAMAEGIVALFQWQNLLFLMAGVTLGIVFGAIPGLGGDTALALLIPLTFGLEPSSGLVLLTSAQGAAAFGGSIPAILMNTPGTGQNTATCFDGYPMAQQGKAGVAIAASAVSSAMGAILSVLILAALLPFARQAILLFSFPEIFMIALVGLSVIAILGRGNMLKGLVSGAIGVALAFIGWEQVNAGLRYTMGIEYLYDGIQLVPVIIGLFAISEAITLLLKGGTIAENSAVRFSFFGKNGAWTGVKAVFSNFGLLLRSTVIGVIVGIVPGVGGSVSNFIAYMQAAKTSSNAERFGKGDVRGVIAPEAANNAKDGGALLPTLAFGIPGSSGMAILMGGFLIHGIAPGRELMTNNLGLVWVVLWALVVSNILAAMLGLVLSPYCSSLTKVPAKILAPVVLVIGVLGAFALHGSMGDVAVAVVFGIVGYYLQKHNYSRISIVIGLILGKLMEQNYHLTLQSVGADGFVTRPISLGLLMLTIFVLASPLLSYRKRRNP